MKVSGVGCGIIQRRNLCEKRFFMIRSSVTPFAVFQKLKSPQNRRFYCTEKHIQSFSEQYELYLKTKEEITQLQSQKKYPEAINKTTKTIEPFLKDWKDSKDVIDLNEIPKKMEIIEFLVTEYSNHSQTILKVPILIQHLLKMQVYLIKNRKDADIKLLEEMYAKKYDLQQRYFEYALLLNRSDKAKSLVQQLEAEEASFPKSDTNDNPLQTICSFRKNICLERLQRTNEEYTFEQPGLEKLFLNSGCRSLQIEGLVELGDIILSHGYHIEGALMYYKIAQTQLYKTILSELPELKAEANNSQPIDFNDIIYMSEQAHDSIREYEEAFPNKNSKDENEEDEQDQEDREMMDNLEKELETLQKNTTKDSKLGEEDTVFIENKDRNENEKPQLDIPSEDDDQKELNRMITQFGDPEEIQFYDFQMALGLKYIMTTLHSVDSVDCIKRIRMKSLLAEFLSTAPIHHLYYAEALEALATQLLIDKNPLSLFIFSLSLSYLKSHPCNPFHASTLEKRIQLKLSMAKLIYPRHPHWNEPDLINAISGFSITFAKPPQEHEEYFSLVDKLSLEGKDIMFSSIPLPRIPYIP